jgi:hypothetical protein
VRAFRNIYFTAELALWCLAAFSFVRLGLQKRWNVMRLLLFLGFSHLAWEATRNTNIFALVAAVVTCANLEEARQLRGATSPGHRAFRFNLAASAFYAVLSLCVVTGVWNLLGEKNKPFGFGEYPGWYIHSACLFAAQPKFPNHAFVMNNGQAGVYIYHNAPYRRVFMDARLEVCSRKTFELCDQIRNRMAAADGGWALSIPRDDKDRLPVVILDTYQSNAEIKGMLQTPGWRLVYADPTAAVFLDESEAKKIPLPAVSAEPLHLSDR